ncbi:MAG: YihY/virulence factor BrkB family protein, partial [Phycisphaerae bacterium]|nr:YihY/virulence factor BrkB family protein [Phycisphaerae bacterium]
MALASFLGVFNMLHRSTDFIKNGLWRIRLDKASKLKIIIIQQLRIVVLSIRGFDEDKCRLRASALTLYSLLSIVPVMAMIFGIAKGFGYEDRIANELLVYFKGQEDVINKVIEFARNLLDNTKGGLI